MRIKCPFCGFEDTAENYEYMYETTLYIMDSDVTREERERPLLVICPRCRQGFFIDNPYKAFYKEH